MEKTIYSKGQYRIVEMIDEMYTIVGLSGDSFNPEANPEVSPSLLIKEEQAFISLVNNVGIFGYALEKWNPEIGKGWEQIDNCFGFVGPYGTDNQHYIVDEFINTIEGK